MLLSKPLQEAMDIIAEMPPGDPGDKVLKRLRELEKEVPSSEFEMFGDIMEAYIANK